MAVKLHRCSIMWFKIGAHPCWKVQKALDEQGVDYEVVKGPLLPGRRKDLERLSGQNKYPVIEFELNFKGLALFNDFSGDVEMPVTPETPEWAIKEQA